MDLWVKCVALFAEAFKLLACKGARELVSNRLERPLIEVTVLASQIQVVQDRQECCNNLALGIFNYCLAVTLSAAAVIGVLSIEALWIFGTLGKLCFNIGSLAISKIGRAHV